MLKKLRMKFVLTNMLFAATMLCIIFGLIYHFTRANLAQESVDMMQSIAQEPLQQGFLGAQTEEIRLPYFTLQIGMHGELIATSGGDFDLSDEEFLMELLELSLSAEEDTGVLEDYNLRFYRGSTPTKYYVVFADITSELVTLDNLVRTSVLIGILSLLVFFGISLLLAQWAVKPVEQAWQQQRQFVADASHELKTPLTVIMTNAELLQNPDYDAQSRSQFTDSILTMSQQMRGLVERLLELARADNGQVQTTFDDVQFSKLVFDAILPFEPIFFEKGLTLSSQLEEDIVLRGSQSHLKQVVEILLDNAQKYSDPQGEVLIKLRRQSRGRCLMSVSNPGPALSQEDLSNIFKRFYRMDKARSRDGGVGLGLAIAQSIVQAHHGRIWAESTNGINTFCVSLPTV